MRKLIFISVILLCICSWANSQEINVSFEASEASPSKIDSIKKEMEFNNGKVAPNFILKDSSDNIVQLNDFKGNVVVIDFWHTSCKPCLGEYPKYKEISNWFSDSSNVTFMGICIDKGNKKALWKKRLKNLNMTGVQLFLPTNKHQNQNNQFYLDSINCYPTYILISKNGHFLGEILNMCDIMTQYQIQQGIEGKTTGESLEEVMTNAEPFSIWFNANAKSLIAK